MTMRRHCLHIGCVCLIVGGAAGCLPSLREPLPADETAAFRRDALRVLEQAAVSDDPVSRMQALEAFQEVAPAEGMRYIADNIDNGYAGVSFAALMAAGTLREQRLLDKVRLRAEDADPSVRIAALFALHRMGDQRRTSELAEFLRHHNDPRVRANAALAIGRLGEKDSVKVLRLAAQQEKKDVVKLQIREALATLDDKHAIEELMFAGYSAVPDQATIALMSLVLAKSHKAEDLFRHSLLRRKEPEIRLQAARGLGRLGIPIGYDVAAAHLFFNSPDRGRKSDPPEQQITRIRALAALALEAVNDPDALGVLREALQARNQPQPVRIAVARAALGILNRNFGRPRPR